MMKTLPLLALALSLMTTQDPAPRAGVAATRQGKWVLAMSGAVLPVGTKLTLITVDSPQQMQRVVVTRRLSDSIDIARNTPGPYYELAAPAGVGEVPGIAVAVLGEPPVARMDSVFSIRLSKQYTDLRVRECASSEGLHLTLWSGAPLKGQRLWHAYFYLGYDVEPNCKPEDYQDGG